MSKKQYTWDQAIEILRNDPAHENLIYDAYLTRDIENNSIRFESSDEFKEVLELVKKNHPNANDILDVPAGNGIASYAFAVNNFNVTAVEPDDSPTLGRKAIETLKEKHNLKINIVCSYGEDLPFEDNSFDVVYVRQGLHHAADLNMMVSEFYRVLRPGGLFLATREHVVDNKNDSLKQFLDNQVDHQLYGGENAFLLSEYKNAILAAGFKRIKLIKPYDSAINLFPNTETSLREKIMDSKFAKILASFLPPRAVFNIGLLALKLSKRPGRLYSFMSVK